MPFWKSVGAQGKRARECYQFWVFKHIHPKADSSKNKSWHVFEGWYYHIAPVWSHQDEWNCTPPRPWHLYLAPNAEAYTLGLQSTFGYQNHYHKRAAFWNQLSMWNLLDFSFNLSKKWASNSLNWQSYDVLKYAPKHQTPSNPKMQHFWYLSVALHPTPCYFRCIYFPWLINRTTQ